MQDTCCLLFSFHEYKYEKCRASHFISLGILNKTILLDPVIYMEHNMSVKLMRGFFCGQNPNRLLVIVNLFQN